MAAPWAMKAIRRHTMPTKLGAPRDPVALDPTGAAPDGAKAVASGSNCGFAPKCERPSRAPALVQSEALFATLKPTCRRPHLH